jgi:hypothetical protein
VTTVVLSNYVNNFNIISPDNGHIINNILLQVNLPTRYKTTVNCHSTSVYNNYKKYYIEIKNSTVTK